MSRPVNEFYWSPERHRVFRTCLKQYYFAYYASWGGWQPEAPAPTRELYYLKCLRTRQQWAGDHVRRALNFLLQNARQGRLSEAEIAEVVARQIEQMRQEFRASRSGAYRADPAGPAGLFEHEYAVAVPEEEWRTLAEGVRRSIENFLASDLWQRLRALPEEAILAIQSRFTFQVDGLPIQTAPDLAIRSGNQVELYEWKTTSDSSETQALQTGVNALLALERWTPDPETLTAVIYHPLESRTEHVSFRSDWLEEVRGWVRDSAEEMLFPLVNPQTNQAGDGENFECVDSREPCGRCSFLRVCPRWRRFTGGK